MTSKHLKNKNGYDLSIEQMKNIESIGENTFKQINILKPELQNLKKEKVETQQALQDAR